MTDDSGLPGDDAAKHDADDVLTIEAPPHTYFGILRRLGPGLIVAGSIVGSGELIATTKTGAEAGFWLLWLIVIGCVIKVFAQVEMGRYSLVGGKTTMYGLNEVPGPSAALSATGDFKRRTIRGNWIVWYWFLMWLASIGQLGGIVGGVGQALAISIPLTEAGEQFNALVEDKTQRQVKEGQLAMSRLRDVPPAIGESQEDLEKKIADLDGRIARAEAALVADYRKRLEEAPPNGEDDEKSAPPSTDDLVQSLGLNEFHRLGGKSDDDTGAVRLVTRLGDERYQSLGGDPQQPEFAALVTALGEQRFEALTGTSVENAAGNSADPAQRAALALFLSQQEKPATPNDEFLWAGLIAVTTSVVLVLGRYRFIQSFSTIMVASFTLITIINLVLLQSNADWSVSLADLVAGMSFRLPPVEEGVVSTGLATALATFGIIGVGASELVTYPYWCLEKGYARFTGPRDDSPEWAERARGWMRVMRWDAWCSMVIYTFATIAFYLLGAAVLGRTGLNPGGNDLIRTLAVMYEPVFGSTAQVLFLFGAFAVLYSTFFVANASHARVFSDAMRVLGFIDPGTVTRQRWIRILSGVFPILCVTIYIAIPSPAELVLLSGLMQAGMLPMLAIAALYFRYVKNDPRIAPGRIWDIFLWVSTLGMGIAGVWAFWEKLTPLFGGS